MTTTHFLTRPTPEEYAEFYAGYVGRVPAGNLIHLLEQQIHDTLTLLRGLSDEQALYRPAPAEWSIKEVAGHMIDTERIFAYRALRIARSDTTPLPGFDQDDYVRAANFDVYPLTDLANEFDLVRQTTVLLFKNLLPEAWTRRGTASNATVSVRALACCIAGHERHHLESLQTVYLP
jgi:hypothetical protein